MSSSPTPQTPKFTKFGQTFISYGSYHSNLINKIIHIICIPVIAATLFAMLSYIPYHFKIGGYEIGVAHIAFVVSMLYYFSIGINAGVIMVVTFAIGYYLWNWAFHGLESTKMRNTLIIINVLAWVLQFIGHGFFEKRKPALMDNIFQIYSAPLFVVIQLLDLLGLRTKEVQEWKVQVQKKVKQFHQSSNKVNVKTA